MPEITIMLRQCVIETCLCKDELFVLYSIDCGNRFSGVAIAGDGRVFLYDLLRDPDQPVKILDVCGSDKPVYSLAFNVKAPELFATTDQQSVKVRDFGKLTQCYVIIWTARSCSDLSYVVYLLSDLT